MSSERRFTVDFTRCLPSVWPRLSWISPQLGRVVVGGAGGGWVGGTACRNPRVPADPATSRGECGRGSRQAVASEVGSALSPPCLGAPGWPSGRSGATQGPAGVTALSGGG